MASVLAESLSWFGRGYEQGRQDRPESPRNAFAELLSGPPKGTEFEQEQWREGYRSWCAGKSPKAWVR